MERKLILRNVVCPVADLSPSAFDVDAFGQQLDLGAGEDKVRLGDLSLTEWERVRLQILPDRLQLGLKEAADGELVRRAAETFLARVDALASGAPIGFNAALLLTLEEGDADPSEKLVNAAALAASLGGADGRGGLTLVYRDDVSRWWIELSPQPDQERSWTYDFNRHFAEFPEAGGDRDEVLDWFADIEAGLVAQLETISMGTD